MKNLTQEEKLARAQVVAFLDSASHAALACDGQGNILHANALVEGLLGWRPEDLVGQSWHSILPQGLPVRGGESTARHQSGQEIPVEAVSVSWPTAADTWTLIFLIDIQERKRAEARMMTNERRLRSIFETAAEGIWLADPEGNTVLINPRMAEMLGYTPEEMLGRPFSDFVHPDDLAKAHQGFRLRKAGDQAPKEYRMRRKDGAAVSVVVTASAIRDEEGRLTGVAAMFTDVTEMRRAERERTEAREQLYRVLENMVDGFVILDREWRFVYMNAAAERIGGQNRKDVLGCSLWELYPDLVASKLHDELALAVTLQQVREFEFYYRPLDLWAVFRCFPAPNGGLAIYVRDVTKLKDAERERAPRTDGSRTTTARQTPGPFARAHPGLERRRCYPLLEPGRRTPLWVDAKRGPGEERT